MTNSNDTLGDRCKQYELTEAGRRLMPLLPILVRLDGKGFSKFTKGLDRPYDLNLSRMMILTTMFLVEETNARIAYTQSDEISLVLYSDSYDSQVFFDGKIQKLVSVLASMATAKFNSLIPEYLPSKSDKLALFDCRAWNVPTLSEATNTILWRCLDAEKNAVSMTARTVYSHKELYGKTTTQQIEMMREKGLIWELKPDFFKYGTFIRRKKIMVDLTEEERSAIPEKFRSLPGVQVERSMLQEFTVPRFSKVVNRTGVLFNGENPKRFEFEAMLEKEVETK